eukprot:CAMPEP_0114511942 /NCGR_PEP_ID=MMETSP0109-20121206/14688_1 /TAXON_ID=29199 /ORGANISM="Chlorarachnion reptans, Strain CCCM449" /LENGTH=563 /DNA_ID=CAMNT_0001691547 /DNA_START=320 /DNA_END=2011 /DNA_ORIENTATION=-
MTSETEVRPERSTRTWWEERGRKWSDRSDDSAGKYDSRSGKYGSGKYDASNRNESYRSKSDRDRWRDSRSDSRRRDGRDRFDRQGRERYDRNDRFASLRRDRTDGRDNRRGNYSSYDQPEDMPEWMDGEEEDDFDFSQNNLEEDRAKYRERHGIDGGGGQDSSSGQQTEALEEGKEKLGRRKETGNVPSGQKIEENVDKGEVEVVNQMLASFGGGLGSGDPFGGGGIERFGKTQSGPTPSRSRFSFGFQGFASSELAAQRKTEDSTKENSLPGTSLGRRSRFGFILNENGANVQNNSGSAARQPRNEDDRFGGMPPGFGSLDGEHADKAENMELPNLPQLPDLPDISQEYPPQKVGISAKQLFLMKNQESKSSRQGMPANQKVEHVHSMEFTQAHGNQRQQNYFAMHRHQESQYTSQQISSNSNQPHQYNQVYPQSFGRGMPTTPQMNHRPPQNMPSHNMMHYMGGHQMQAHSRQSVPQHYVDRHAQHQQQQRQQMLRHRQPHVNFQQQQQPQQWEAAGRPPANAQYQNYAQLQAQHYRHPEEGEAGKKQEGQGFRKFFGHML